MTLKNEVTGDGIFFFYTLPFIIATKEAKVEESILSHMLNSSDGENVILHNYMSWGSR